MKIVLVAFYDVHSIGVRMLHAILKEAGYDVASVYFKEYYTDGESTDEDLL